MFNKAVAETFGQEYASVFLGLSNDEAMNTKYKNRKNFNYLVNQGRGAESVFFAALADSLVRRDYKTYTETSVDYVVTCSNNFFDTTGGHILNV